MTRSLLRRPVPQSAKNIVSSNSDIEKESKNEEYVFEAKVLDENISTADKPQADAVREKLADKIESPQENKPEVANCIVSDAPVVPNQDNPTTLSAVSTDNIAKTAKRSGDYGIGRRHPMPADKCKINIEDLPVEKTQPQTQSEAVVSEKHIADSFFMPTILSQFLRIMLIGLAAVAAFFAITQTTAFLANIRKLSLLEQIVLTLPLAAFGCVIVWIIIKLLIYACKLKVAPQIKIKALQELEKRRSLRQLSLRKNREAVEKLSQYLQKEFSINTETLNTWGVHSDFIKKLEKNRQTLIEQAHTPTGTSQDWLADFRCNIQDKLDEIAQKRILKYSMNTAVMTGMSPFAMIDRLIVLSSSLGMLKELLELYSLKPRWDKNLVLMAQVIINTYCAGVIDEMSDSALDNIASVAEKSAVQIPDFALKIAGKTTESAMQGCMVYRLGKSALKILHPVDNQ